MSDWIGCNDAGEPDYATLHVSEADGTTHDLSKTRVRGLYVSDMIAHNNDHKRYVFQITARA